MAIRFHAAALKLKIHRFPRPEGFSASSAAMGGAICRICCNRPAESGDALDSMGKPWPYKQTEDL